MRTASDIQGLIQATDTRKALEQVDLRRSSVNGELPLSPISGPRYAATGSEIIPVFGSGKTSVFETLGKNQRLMVPSGIEHDSILEFTSSDGKVHYGQVVTSKDSKKTKLEVKEITREEAKTHHRTTDAKIYSVSESYVKHYRKPGLVGTVLSLLDPSENLVMKLVTMLLVGDMFNSADMMDVFMKLYVRVILIAGLIILASVIIAQLM